MDSPATLLAVLIAQSEATYAEIVDGFHQCARAHDEDASISERTLRRWMSGAIGAPRPAQRRVARLYWGFPMAELLAPVPAEVLVSPQTAMAHPFGSTLSAHSVPDQRTQPLDEGQILERQMAMSTSRAARFTSYAEGSNIGPETLDQIRDEAVELANAYIREPLATIAGPLVGLQDAVFTLLEGKQKPAQSKDLYVLASIVSGMLAKASHDLGRPYEAMTQARTMFVCADNADHLPLRAWARGLQSLIAFWNNRHEEAVRYADNGAALLGGHTGSVAAWLPSLSARSLAYLGRADDARQAIQRAGDLREQSSADDLDQIGGLFMFPQAKQHYYAAGAYVVLDGGDDDAASEATTALDLFEHGVPQYRSFSDEAGARSELALARVHSGDLDGARTALTEVLDLEPARRIGGVIPSAIRVHNALSARQFAGSSAARQLREEIEVFSRTPAAAITSH
jgi:tetratricopeptide (TPR) repeat protein